MIFTTFQDTSRRRFQELVALDLEYKKSGIVVHTAVGPDTDTTLEIAAGSSLCQTPGTQSTD